MKRYKSLFIILIGIFICFCFTACSKKVTVIAEMGEIDCEEYFICTESSRGMVISEYIGESSIVKIPSKVYDSETNKTYNIIGINNYAFYENTAIEEIVLPKSVIYIGNYAFYGCTNLTTINLHYAEIIRNYAFYDCYNLSELQLYYCNMIGDYAFYNCYNCEINLHYGGLLKNESKSLHSIRIGENAFGIDLID